MKEVKLYIIVREDLQMSPGKMAAQCVHAAFKYLMRKGRFFQEDLECQLAFHVYDGAPEFQHFMTGRFGPPIIVIKKVKSEEQLRNILKKAEDAGLRTGAQIDIGLHELEGENFTAVAIGPNYVEDCEPIVTRLRNL